MKTLSRYTALLAPFLVLGFAAFLYAGSFYITKVSHADGIGSELMPRVICAILFLVGVCMLIQSLFALRRQKISEAGKTEELASNRPTGHAVPLSILAMLVYVLCLEPVGFVLSSMLYLPVQMLLLSLNTRRNYIAIAACSLIVPLVTYLLFEYAFELLLPQGIFG